MAYQTTWVIGDHAVGPVRSVTRDASSFLGDALDLAELQVQLLRCDSRAALSRAKPAIAGIVCALGILIASLPVLGEGVASLIAWATDWPLWIAQLIVGVLFALVGVLTAWLGVRSLRTALTSFSTTQKEVAANIRWLRQSLSNAASGD
ncbi:MAG: phage holin family protein [Pirellulales bacterium]